MLKTILFAAAMVAPAAAVAQTAPEQATIYANGLQQFVGTKIQGKTKISEIKAVYDTVVFTVAGQIWPSNPEKATAKFIEGLCQGAPNFFVSGVKVRLYFSGTDREEPTDGPTVDRCPPPSPRR